MNIMYFTVMLFSFVGNLFDISISNKYSEYIDNGFYIFTMSMDDNIVAERNTVRRKGWIERSLDS